MSIGPGLALSEVVEQANVTSFFSPTIGGAEVEVRLSQLSEVSESRFEGKNGRDGNNDDTDGELRSMQSDLRRS